jgi:hypothetical protein
VHQDFPPHGHRHRLNKESQLLAEHFHPDRQLAIRLHPALQLAKQQDPYPVFDFLKLKKLRAPHQLALEYHRVFQQKQGSQQYPYIYKCPLLRREGLCIALR